MKGIYNVIFVLLHIMGTLLVVTVCTSRFVWYVDWNLREELMFWACPLVVYSIHYGLILIGRYKKVLIDKVLKGLKIWELILYSAQLLILAMFFVVDLLDLHLKLGQYVPIVIINLLVLVVGKVSISKNI